MVKNETKSEEVTKLPFQNLGQYLDTYVKVTALSATKTSSRTELEKSIWILNMAKFSKRDIAKILHVSRNTIGPVLQGKRLKEEDIENDK